MRRALIALLLLSPSTAVAKKRPSPSPTPTPVPAPSLPAVPDPPFVEAAPAPHVRSPEAAVFAAFKGSLCAVTATRIQEDGSPGGVSQGTAFVIHSSGLLLTNHHVVAGASELAVRFSDGRAVPARLAGANPALDLAVLRIETDHPITPAILGDSDKIEEGDEVLALGQPLGLGATITRGILSGKERRVDVGAIGAAGSPIAYLQTDAAINPGSSGGPLVDLSGAVVGITTAIIPSAKGVAFAIPINAVKAAIPAMLRDAGIGHAFLGLTLGPGTASGAEVLSLRPGGPAARAGLRTGDVVTAIQGRDISSDADIAAAVTDLAVHETVSLRYLRRGRVSTAEITAVEVPPPQPHPDSMILGGAVLSEFGPSSDAAARSGQSSGVLVSNVPPNSPAAKAGVKPGDVLLVVGMDSVGDFDDLRIALDRETDAEAFKVFVRRGEKSLTVIVPR